MVPMGVVDEDVAHVLEPKAQPADVGGDLGSALLHRPVDQDMTGIAGDEIGADPRRPDIIDIAEDPERRHRPVPFGALLLEGILGGGGDGENEQARGNNRTKH